MVNLPEVNVTTTFVTGSQVKTGSEYNVPLNLNDAVGEFVFQFRISDSLGSLTHLTQQFLEKRNGRKRMDKSEVILS